MTTSISYKINDTVNGIFATVYLPEGEFHLRLDYRRGMNNRRTWTIRGNYPEDKYLISYENGELFVLPKSSGDEFVEGATVEHSRFGKGLVTSATKNVVNVTFEKYGNKSLAKSIIANTMKVI